MKRGEIWLVNLDPTIGSEIKKTRPCVIVSPQELNQHLRTVMMAPMTSKGFAAPFRVPVTHAGTKGLIVLDQMRAVDKQRLVKKLGQVSAKTMGRVLKTLQELFAESFLLTLLSAITCTTFRRLKLQQPLLLLQLYLFLPENKIHINHFLF